MLRDIKYTSIKIWENTKVIYICHEVTHSIIIIYLIVCYIINITRSSYKNYCIWGDNWKYIYIDVISIDEINRDRDRNNFTVREMRNVAGSDARFNFERDILERENARKGGVGWRWEKDLKTSSSREKRKLHF